MVTTPADISRTLNGIEQLIKNGQLRSSLQAFVKVGNKLYGDIRMTTQVYEKLETKILNWVQFVKENPNSLTETSDGRFAATKEGNKIGWQPMFNGLAGRHRTQVVTTQGNEETSFSNTVVSPKDMDTFEKESINRKPIVNLPKRQPVVRLLSTIPKSTLISNTQRLQDGEDHLKVDMSRETVQVPLARPTPNKLPAKPKVLSASIWASATESDPLELVNGVPEWRKGFKSEAGEAFDDTPVINIHTKPNKSVMQTSLPDSTLKTNSSILDQNLIDLGSMVDAASTLVASSDSSDEDLIELEPKIAKAFKTKGRGKFTMELVHWFTREEKSETKEKEFEEKDDGWTGSEGKGLEKNEFEEHGREQMESAENKPQLVKPEVIRSEKEIRLATMLALRHKVPNALHASLKSRLHVLGLERNGADWKRPAVGTMVPKPKKERPIGELSYRKTNGTSADRGSLATIL